MLGVIIHRVWNSTTWSFRYNGATEFIASKKPVAGKNELHEFCMISFEIQRAKSTNDLEREDAPSSSADGSSGDEDTSP